MNLFVAFLYYVCFEGVLVVVAGWFVYVGVGYVGDHFFWDARDLVVPFDVGRLRSRVVVVLYR